MPDAAAGQTGRCPVCNTLFNVPDKDQAVQSQAITPARRTAVAQPMPAPVLGEDAPTTGLTIAQKTGFVAIAVGVLAFIVLLVLLNPSTDSPKTDDGSKLAVDASRKLSPPRREPLPKPKPTATAPSVPEPKLPARADPVEKPRQLDDTTPEEDVGPKTNAGNPPQRPPEDTPKAKPPVVTRESPSKAPIDPPRRDPPKKEVMATDATPVEPRPSSPVETARPGGANIYERLLKSTVMVLRKDETGTRATRGTGSLVHREQRLILTNYHVVGDASEVFVTFPVYERGKLIVASKTYLERFRNNEFLHAKVLRVHKEQDVALVQLDKLPAGVPALRLAARSARPGEVVHSIGNPGASEAAWLYTKGEVRQVSHKKWDARGTDHVMTFDADVLETTSPTNPGDSGGPLVDDFVRLVGVTQGANTAARGVSLFIDISEVRKLLKEQGIDDDEAASDVARPDNPAVEEIAKGLTSADAKTRAEAAARLADLGPDAKAALHELIRALDDADRSVRKQAGSALLQMGSPERGDIRRSDLLPLRACLRDETTTGELQRWVVKALMQLGADAKPAVPELGQLVKSEDKETRLAALAALEKLGPVPSSILKDAAAAMKSDDRMQNGRFAMALIKLDPELKTDEGKAAVDTLIALQKPLSTEDLVNKDLLTLVNEAGKALTNLGKPVLPLLRKAMITTYRGGNLTGDAEFANAAVRLAMLRAIEAMGAKAYSAAMDTDLQWLEARDPVVQVRDAARQLRAKIQPK